MIPGITLPSDALRMGLKAALYFLIAALALGLVLTRGKLETEKANTKALTSMYQAASAQASANAVIKARAIETLHASATNKGSQDYETKRADLGRRYAAASVPASQAHSSGPGRTGLPGAAAVPGQPDDPAICDGLSFRLAREADENTLKLVELQKLIIQLGLYKNN